MTCACGHDPSSHHNGTEACQVCDDIYVCPVYEAAPPCRYCGHPLASHSGPYCMEPPS